MWEISNLSQLTGFAYSALFGCIFCLAYDILRASRTVVKPGVWAVFTEDIIYALICAPVAFCLLLAVTGGELRIFVFFGLLCGFVLFRLTLSRFFLFVFEKAFAFSVFIISKIKALFNLICLKTDKLFTVIRKKIACLTPKSKKKA